MLLIFCNSNEAESLSNTSKCLGIIGTHILPSILATFFQCFDGLTDDANFVKYRPAVAGHSCMCAKCRAEVHLLRRH